MRKNTIFTIIIKKCGVSTINSDKIDMKKDVIFTFLFSLIVIGCSKENNEVNSTTSGIVFNTSVTYGTMTDQDNNTYKTVTIGGQTWMAENLRTTKYRNGDDIPNVEGKTQWSITETGAFCWYNNDSSSYKSVYGAVYNWYAVNDSRNIAPAGWHVASTDEYNTLIAYIGGVSVSGASNTWSCAEKLKETGTTHWKSPNTGTNETGFTAEPCGGRNYYGEFLPMGIFPHYWTTVGESPDSFVQTADAFCFYNNTSNIYWTVDSKMSGNCVRCVKDN